MDRGKESVKLFNQTVARTASTQYYIKPKHFTRWIKKKGWKERLGFAKQVSEMPVREASWCLRDLQQRQTVWQCLQGLRLLVHIATAQDESSSLSTVLM